MRVVVLAGFCVWVLAVEARAQGSWKSLNPAVYRAVESVSRERLDATLRKLESFETRSTNSDTMSPVRGIGAARQWIFDQFKGYSPRLEVSFDSYRVAKGGRLTHDTDLRNVVAVLPGTDPNRRDIRFLISGHYDTTVGQEGGDNARAPGVNDDGSGTALVLEAARILSQFEFPNTLVFVAFAGEEQGLVGSSLMAQKAKQESWKIGGVLNNDIVGNSVGGNGAVASQTVRVFSEDPNDSPSRQLSRLVKEIGERYVPTMNVDLIFRYDRFGRGGDHTPFNIEGFSAVRITVSSENYSRQHTPEDTIEGVDLDYLSRVARVNIAAAANLALAPTMPQVLDPRGAPMLGRGQSRYDAELRWQASAGDVAGYVVLMRKTTSPAWEREVWVGNLTQYLFKNVSIDEWTFGVKAVGTDGTESVTNAYVNPPRQRAVYPTLPR